LCREIAKAHGGELTLQTAPGRVVVMRLQVPDHQARADSVL
jgi:signal transduction histidine kinase